MTWTLRKILQATYRNKEFRNRFKYAARDVIKRIEIQKQQELQSGATTFLIKSSSYPNYWPYYTILDARNRERKYQRSVRHDYDVVISLPSLSIDVPFTARVGKEGLWRDTKRATRKKRNRTYKIEEDKNVLRGLNGDFYFRCEASWSREGILFGRRFSTHNPNNPIFAPKHLISVINILLKRGILR